MGLVAAGLVMVVLGVLLRQFPEVTGKIGSRALEIERARNVEGRGPIRVRNLTAAVMAGIGMILIVAGIFNW